MKEFFAPTLLRWYDQNKRELPWRQTQDPYRIWISEIILQQTRVAQGWAYFLRFIERFPDLQTLALAQEDEVLLLWQGLGYYSRARNLYAAARIIYTQHQGHFPTPWEAVRALPGIGEYTASAICSFAYGQPTAVVDGNVYRVLGRLFGVDTPIDSTAGKKKFAQLANSLISHQRPGDYNQAIMDFGATACTPQKPVCQNQRTLCPFAERCQALALNQVDDLPVKTKKTTVKTRYFHYLHLRKEGVSWLYKRTQDDIWRHLYEFPVIESDTLLSEQEMLEHPLVREWLQSAGKIQPVQHTAMPRHQLSHQHIHATFFEWKIEKIPSEWTSEGNSWVAVPENEPIQFPISRLMETYLAKKQNFQSK